MRGQKGARCQVPKCQVRGGGQASMGRIIFQVVLRAKRTPPQPQLVPSPAIGQPLTGT